MKKIMIAACAVICLSIASGCSGTMTEVDEQHLSSEHLKVGEEVLRLMEAEQPKKVQGGAVIRHHRSTTKELLRKQK